MADCTRDGPILGTAANMNAAGIVFEEDGDHEHICCLDHVIQVSKKSLRVLVLLQRMSHVVFDACVCLLTTVDSKVDI